MIVIPMLLFAVVMSSLDLGIVKIGFGVYANLLGNDPRNLLSVCGVCLILAGLSVLWVREGRAGAAAPELSIA
jgi:maltose/moltooligosaccharide transporter